MINLELPEIETLRRDLEREIVGRKVKSAQAVVMKPLEGIKTKADFEKAIIGAKIEAVGRSGMAIIITLDNEMNLVVQLGENGRIEKQPTRQDNASDIVAVVTFTQGGDLRIADKKGTSTISVVHDDDVEDTLPPAEERGLDLLDSPLSWVEFGRLVLNQDMPLKLLLTDPSVFVGIGDIYSNEILFDAGLRHDRSSSTLSTQEIRRLYRSVVGIMHDAIKYRGTSLEERPFLDLHGEPGEYGDHLAVFGKTGELSPRSREPIKKTSFKHQVVYYCNTQV